MNVATNTNTAFALTYPAFYQAFNNLELIIVCSQEPDSCFKFPGFISLGMSDLSFDVYRIVFLKSYKYESLIQKPNLTQTDFY